MTKFPINRREFGHKSFLDYRLKYGFRSNIIGVTFSVSSEGDDFCSIDDLQAIYFPLVTSFLMLRSFGTITTLLLKTMISSSIQNNCLPFKSRVYRTSHSGFNGV